MKKQKRTTLASNLAQLAIDDHLGCFGEFNINDTVCKKFCALNLRCIIERDQNSRMEILEDLLSGEGAFQ
jgi:hypothetical protein